MDSASIFLLCALLSSFPGNVPAAVVTLHSIALYHTRDLIGDPTVYFQCKGENKTILPDVKEARVVYIFTRKETWQPLTDFSSGKCKKCGLYEEDKFPWPSSDAYYAWNICPSSFKSPDGLHIFIREGGFFAAFSCPACLDLDDVPYDEDDGPALRRLRVEVGIGLFIIIVVIITVIVRFKIREKRKKSGNETTSSEP